MLLKKITQSTEWETNGKTVRTKGGTYVGCASTEFNAQIFAASPKFLELLNKLSEQNPELKNEVNNILSSVV